MHTRSCFVVICIIWMILFPFNIKTTAIDGFALTLDNDFFMGQDDGYTNGLYAAWYTSGRDIKPSILVWPLKWSLSKKTPEYSIKTYSVGQSMFTPDDIEKENPDPDDLPYAGLLFGSYTLINVYTNHADYVSTMLGVVGPASGAEYSQKTIHKVIGAQEPKGWDYQLHNEVVFRFARGRMWRHWVSNDGRFDFLSTAEIGLGTLESSLGGGFGIRFGNTLSDSYVTGALQSSRTTNLMASNREFYIYLGFGGRFIVNNILMNGNTFEDSRSAESDHTQVGIQAGFAYKWDQLSISLAVMNFSMFEDRVSQDERLGTFTLAWHF